jgi:hypothetical protein
MKGWLEKQANPGRKAEGAQMPREVAEMAREAAEMPMEASKHPKENVQL